MFLNFINWVQPFIHCLLFNFIIVDVVFFQIKETQKMKTNIESDKKLYNLRIIIKIKNKNDKYIINKCFIQLEKKYQNK